MSSGWGTPQKGHQPRSAWLDKAQVPWLRVFVEGVVIVGSILLAFGIQAWWDEVQEREEEQEYLEQLWADLERGEQQLLDAAVAEEFRAQSVLMVIAASQETEPPPNDSIAAWLGAAGSYFEGVPTLATAQGLITSNDIQSIRSHEVRAGVVNLVDQIRQWELRQVPQEQRILDALQRLNRIVDPLTRGRQRSVGSGGNAPDSLTRSTQVQGAVTTDLRTLLQDADFRATVDELYIGHENLRWYVQGMLNETRSLKREVGRALQGS